MTEGLLSGRPFYIELEEHMSAYRVVSRLDHDGRRYGPGDDAPNMSNSQRNRLIDLNVIEEIKVSLKTKPSDKTSEAKPLSKLNKSELEAMAEGMELDLSSCSNNAERIALIEADIQRLVEDKGNAAGVNDNLTGVDPTLS